MQIRNIWCDIWYSMPTEIAKKNTGHTSINKRGPISKVCFYKLFEWNAVMYLVCTAFYKFT